MEAADPTIVWLIEDDPLFRHVLYDLLDDAPDLTVAHAFGACEPAIAALEQGELPDVILSDIGLPGMTGTEGARHLKALSPASHIIMLTVHEDEDRIFDALCAGASGYLLKNASSDRIVAAIREVRRGGLSFTAPVARKVLHLFQQQATTPRTDYGLTDREKEILHFISEGLTQKELAERLFLSRHTVEAHLRNIYTKLHVRNGIAAVSKAIRERII